MSDVDDWLGRDEFEHSFLMYVTTDPTIRMVGLFNNVDLVAVMAYKHIFCRIFFMFKDVVEDIFFPRL